MPNPTEALAQFAATLDYERIPQRAREYTKDLLLDTLACAVAGHQGEETEQVEAFASALAQSNESSIIGGDRLSLAGATLLERLSRDRGHDVRRPPLDAHAHHARSHAARARRSPSATDCSGRDLLVALAAGCEVTTRVGIGLDFPEFRKRGWHGPGVIGPFGAAAAVGRLLGFDAETMARAFGLAGSQAAGTFAAWGTPTVKFHQCRGALSGLMAALLAEQGFVATKEFLTAQDGGLYNTYTNGGKPEAAIDGARRALGARADRAAPVAFGVDDPGPHHGDVRSRRAERARRRARCARSASRSARPRTTCTASSRATRASSKRCCRRTTRPR